jgi:antitoxin component YwqK of YwqJK toxin-antitoxin module
MSLKQPDKTRVDENQIVYGELDNDGGCKVYYNGGYYTGYVVQDRSTNGTILGEIEYKNGSHLGWDNEYNESGQLIRETLTVGETSLRFYIYDQNGNKIGGGELVGSTYYKEMVAKYNLD